MKIKSIRALLPTLCLALLLMSLPQRHTNAIRGAAVASLAPLWELLTKIKKKKLNRVEDVEKQQLALENQRLKAEINKLREWFNLDLNDVLNLDLQPIPAQVIFRSPATWDQSLWINVGKSTNQRLGKEIIQKNSPVIVGKSVVGLIDYVGAKQSRIRLVTDSGLPLSVRVSRTDGQTTHYLAKGELQGAIKKSSKTNQYILRGTGFNYDFADDEGPGRDLRTGKPLEGKKPAIPLIKVGDLLITTGFDGVFPAGLQAARVSKIFPLKEGDYYYDIEALPSENHLDELSLVFVLQPQGYDPEDLPNEEYTLK